MTGIQQGIQSGHSALRFALKYGRCNPNHIIWDFIENYQTWVILNGGTTNASLEETGTLDVIHRSLIENGIECTPFYEPDLNNALTAVCFICDERVFNKELYPDYDGTWDGNEKTWEDNDYEKWIELLGEKKCISSRVVRR